MSSLGLSCQDDEPFVGIVSRSEFFEYHDESAPPVCSTVLSLLDRHAQVVGGILGLVPSRDRPFRYYRFDSSARLSDECHASLVHGCAPGDAVYSTYLAEAHELTHAYAYRAWGAQSVGLLEEGEAVALSCDGGTYVPSAEIGSWRDALYTGGDILENTWAGGFVSYLARHYGWPSVGELHRRAPPGTSATDFEIAFAHVFPTSMDHAWAEAKESIANNCQLAEIITGNCQLGCDDSLLEDVTPLLDELSAAATECDALERR